MPFGPFDDPIARDPARWRSGFLRRALPAAALTLTAVSTALAEDAPKPSLLPETVVTATRMATPSREVGSSITVVTGEELARRKISFVADALRGLPGVTVNRTSTRGSFTEVRIRGAEANQTLVLIDGMKVNDPALSSQFDFANLLVNEIDRIEVLRGPQSVLYGSDAVGGVINIITKRGAGTPVVTASAGYGSFNTLETKGGIRAGGKRYSVSLGGSYYRTDGISAASEDRGNSESDPYRNRAVNGNAAFRPWDILQLSLGGRWRRGKQETDAFTFVAVDDDSFTESRERSGRAEIKLTLLDGMWENRLSGSLFENELDSDGGAFGASNTTGNRRKWQYQTDFIFETRATVASKHTATFGVENERNRVRAQSAFSDIDRSIESQSYFGQYQIGLVDRFFLTGGGRFDDNDLFENTTTYRVTGAVQFPETSSKLHASIGTAVKNPTLFELFGFTSTFTGNPNLQSESARGFDVGVEQKLFGGRFVGDVTFFQNRIDNLIQGFGSTAINLSGTTRITGVEMAGRAQLTDGLGISGSYTWMTTKDATGTQLVRRPRHAASVKLDYRFLEEKRANVSVDLNFNGPQRDNAFGPLRQETLGGYVLLNAAASYRVSDQVEVFVRAENLLNQSYEEIYTFGTPGISAFGGVRIRFEPLTLLKGKA
jgi:vitamin B12 transporter